MRGERRALSSVNEYDKKSLVDCEAKSEFYAKIQGSVSLDEVFTGRCVKADSFAHKYYRSSTVMILDYFRIKLSG